MKKLLSTLSLLLVVLIQTNAQGTIQNGAIVSFEKEVHDFGTMKQGGDASTDFKFKNTGTEPLIISNAQGSCGCTVPEWPKEPIKPGESAAIKVKYDSKRVGPINKSVTITSNATNEPTKVIRITGNIEAVPQPDAEQAFPMKETPAGAPVEKHN